MGAHHFATWFAGQREVTDRERVRSARLRMPPAIAECVELLHIAELDSGLPFNPFAQTHFECSVGAGRERPEGQGIPVAGSRGTRAGHENMGLLIAHHDDGGVQSEFDMRIVVGRFCCGHGLGGVLRGQRENLALFSELTTADMLHGVRHASLA